MRPSLPTAAAHLIPHVPGARQRQFITRARAPRSSDRKLVWESTDEDWDAPFVPPGGEKGATEEQQQRVIVALGKFDAMHKGHKLLALTAAQMGGAPWLLSFSGMGEVLGWPERKPLVAPCDRPRVLESWGRACWRSAAAARGAEAAREDEGDRGKGVLVPRLRSIPFAEIRSMSPEEFVVLLADGMRVHGVVAGTNYRFGYRAAGDTELLVDLGAKHSLQVRILELLESFDLDADSPGDDLDLPSSQVSSSNIREALQRGTDADMERVQSWLDRDYRAVAIFGADAVASCLPPGDGEAQKPIRVPAAAFQNLLPAPGSYRCRAGLTPLPENGFSIPTTLDEAEGLWCDGASVEIAESGEVTVRLQGPMCRGLCSDSADEASEVESTITSRSKNNGVGLLGGANEALRLCLDFL